MLENGLDLHVNERQMIRHYRARSTGEVEEEECQIAIFTSCGAHVNCAIMPMLYTHSIRNPPQNTMVVFKMRDSIPSARYSPICNVLRQWKTSLIPIYRVYRLYDIPYFIE